MVGHVASVAGPRHAVLCAVSAAGFPARPRAVAPLAVGAARDTKRRSKRARDHERAPHCASARLRGRVACCTDACRRAGCFYGVGRGGVCGTRNRARYGAGRDAATRSARRCALRQPHTARCSRVGRGLGAGPHVAAGSVRATKPWSMPSSPRSSAPRRTSAPIPAHCSAVVSTACLKLSAAGTRGRPSRARPAVGVMGVLAGGVGGGGAAVVGVVVAQLEDQQRQGQTGQCRRGSRSPARKLSLPGQGRG